MADKLTVKLPGRRRRDDSKCYWIGGFAWALRKTLGIGGKEGLGVAVNIFVGMVSSHPKRTVGLLAISAAIPALFYWIAGWIAVAAGIGLIGGLVGMQTYKREGRRSPWRRRCGTGSRRGNHPAPSAPTGMPAASQTALQRRRLETILDKARRQAVDDHDAYGAKNSCLDVIRRTEKDDPLFLEACDLYLSVAAPRPPHAPAGRNPETLSPKTPPDLHIPADLANVIPFPRSACRR